MLSEIIDKGCTTLLGRNATEDDFNALSAEAMAARKAFNVANEAYYATEMVRNDAQAYLAKVVRARDNVEVNLASPLSEERLAGEG